MDVKVYELTQAEKKLRLEFGKYAKQADGSVMISIDNTYLLVTAVSSNKPREGVDFLPLSVDYREKAYAAGRIPGGFFKREGRPSTREVLSSRLVDRSIRPLFPKDYFYDIQVLLSVVSFDQENDPDTIGVLGASVALLISDIPFAGPIGCVRVGRVADKFILNPSVSLRTESSLDIVVAGTGESIMMVEGKAKELPETLFVEALKFAKPYLAEQVNLQKKIAEEIGKPKRKYETVIIPSGLQNIVKNEAEARLPSLLKIKAKQERNRAINSFKKQLTDKLSKDYPDSELFISNIVEEIKKKLIRRMIVETGKRMDGRKLDEIRNVSCEVGFLPMTHGSALFTRGETQSLSVLTLGTKFDEQKVEDLEGESFKSFLLHYNFPPFSVGEVSPMRGPGRREIGHGSLAEKALLQIIPTESVFPYTIRIVSDILESNGSSSMATVCAGSLALMDAGVPIKAPVAGVAMGLVQEDGKDFILADILGEEDHCGDMDFKVAGTRKGVTAFQMDIKVQKLSLETLALALKIACEKRLEILDIMSSVIAVPRANLSAFAPRIKILKIPVHKIGELIGTGGKVIRSIQEEASATINISPDGTICVSANSEEGLGIALERIGQITAEPEVGKVYKGTVKKITSFGAFVEILPHYEGLLHISEIEHRRVNRVEDVLREGQVIEVKVIAVDETGRIKLSRKALLKKHR